MKISVALVTYNHRPFIEQALESVLRQKVSCDWEIVIGDDASTDGTADILEAYQRRHPDRIRLKLRNINAGDGGRTNFIDTLDACRGDYVAYLDGDDYWLDEHKLAYQARLLDSQPHLSGCAHPVRRVYEDGRSDIFAAPRGRTLFTLADVARNFTFLHCSSIMYRKAALPRWFADNRLKLDDWTLTVLCARRGDIGYIDEVLGIYRKHGSGLWTGQQSLQRQLWDLTTREYVLGKSATSGETQARKDELFHRATRKAGQNIKRGNLLAARCQLTLALARFPFRNSLSPRYYLMFLIETWAAFSKPLLLALRRMLHL